MPLPRRGADPDLADLVRTRLDTILGRDPRTSGERSPAAAGSVAAGPVEPATSTGDLGRSDAELRVRAFGARQLTVVAVVVLVALVVTAGIMVRARPVPLAGPVPTGSASVSAPPAAAGPAQQSTAPASARPTATVVHVVGAVRNPGLVTLTGRARVADAIEAAGGLTSRADPAELNLAQSLVDGQQVVIGTEREPRGEIRDGGVGSGAGPPAVGDGASAVLDLNAATADQLDQALPGVGPVTAAKIVAWRTEHGRFTRVEELQEVAGIGPRTYAEIVPHVRV